MPQMKRLTFAWHPAHPALAIRRGSDYKATRRNGNVFSLLSRGEVQGNRIGRSTVGLGEVRRGERERGEGREGERARGAHR